MLKSRTCASVPCQWLMLSGVGNVSYAELQGIDFTSFNTKKRKLDERISGLTSQAYQTQAKPRTAYGPSTQQISKFYEHLHASGTKRAILSLASPYNKDYVTKKSAMDLPTTLDGLYSEQLSRKSFTELLTKVDEVFTEMSCSEEQAVNVEESTREQRNSKVWTKMRAERITASNFHQICHINPAKPSLNLIEQICYNSNFQFAATDWGIQQETLHRFSRRFKLFASLSLPRSAQFIMVIHFQTKISKHNTISESYYQQFLLIKASDPKARKLK